MKNFNLSNFIEVTLKKENRKMILQYGTILFLINFLKDSNDVVLFGERRRNV